MPARGTDDTELALLFQVVFEDSCFDDLRRNDEFRQLERQLLGALR